MRRNLIHTGLSALVICMMSVGLVAQTFPTPTGFTLPAGKTIVITYDVDVNANACTPGTVPPANLSNQASVSGGFPGSPKPTDDPAFPGVMDPTLTPFAGLTIGNLVYNDDNRNGIFDAGDTGINEVMLNLYQDVNSNNMLDAGDGAAVATATTANMSGEDGRYAFSVCPGTYIVQVAPSNFNMGGALYNMGVPFVSSPLSGAGDPDVDLDDDDDNGDAVSGFGVATAAFTISTDNNNIDFGFKTPTGISIGDVTMEDEGTGGTTTAFNFTVTRTSMEDAINLTVNTMDGTAASPDDFAAISGGIVSFPAGMSNTQTVTVLVNHDNVVETDETFTVVLSGAPAHANITDDSGLGTITNDDNATVTLSANASQNEGNSGSANYTFTATLNNPVQESFSIAYSTSNNTAIAGSDYTNTSGSLSFTGTAGEEQFIQVPILGDMVVELDETFTVALGAITGAPAGVTAGPSLMRTITNDDQATVTISNVSQNEGNAGPSNFNFTITLNGVVDAPVMLSASTVDGSALVGNNDYSLTVGNLTFPANGPSTQVELIAVGVNGDMTFEPNETFLLRLSSLAASGRNVVFSPGGTTLDGTATILNDDLPPVIINELDCDTDGTDVAEFVELYDGGVGNTSLNGLVLVFYNGANDLSYRAIDLDGFTTDANGYFLAGNSGVPGVDVIFPGDGLQNGADAVALYTGNATDFNNTPITLTNLIDAVVYDTDDADDPGLLGLLNAGQPQVDEHGGGFGACHSIQRISNGSGGPRNTNTYQALPPTPKAANFVPEVTISVSPASVLEDGVTDLTYTITRTGSTACALSVSYTVGGTATSGTDYPAIAASPITIPTGSASVDIVVNPNSDNVVEADETVIITLTDGALYDLGTSSMATGTITNDDQATLTLAAFDASKPEGTGAGSTILKFRVTLDNPVAGGFQANYQTNDITAMTADNDYTDNDGFLTFAGTAGEFHDIDVVVTRDNKVELDQTIETEMVSLSLLSVNPLSVTLAGSPQTGTILNDDSAVITMGSVSELESNGGIIFNVSLSNPVDANISFNRAVSDGTAELSDNDYGATGGNTNIFSPQLGVGFSVTIPNDNKVETNEDFQVTLSSLNAMGRDVTFEGGGSTLSATGIILNDDQTILTLSAFDASKNEGNTGTTPFTFRATLGNPVQDGFTIGYVTNEGTATLADMDYMDNDNSLLFTGTENEFHDITILVNGDNVVEANETFEVALTVLSSLQVDDSDILISFSPQTGTILNDEVDFGDLPDPTFPTLVASNGARHQTVLGFQLGANLDGEPNGQPSATAEGDDNDTDDDEDGVTFTSAVNACQTASVTVNAPMGGELNAWIDFNLNGNFTDAGEQIFSDETLAFGDNFLTFNVPCTAAGGTPFARFRLNSTGGLSYDGPAADGEVEDYRVVTTQFSIDDPVAINEGNMGTTDLVFTVSRSNIFSNCSVEYSITGGTATLGDADFTLITPSPISFTAGGDPTASIIVRVNGDTKVELDEMVEVSLSNPVNGSILDDLGIGTINNDDSAILSITSPTVTEGDVSTQNMTFDLSLNNPSDANVVVNFATMNGTATTADLDYQNNSGSHTFTPGQTTKQVIVLINGDCKIEPNEQFTGQLSSLNANSRNVTLSGGGSTLSGTGTINNNDAAPMITCPGPITISCDASQLPANTGMATASDNCSPPPTLGYTDVITPGSCAGNYTIARTWKATDNTGDMSTCVQTITVVDNTPPTPVCRTNTVFIGAGGSYTLQASDVLDMNATTDNCGTVSVFSITPATVTCAQLNQTINVVVVVKDDCGNSAQCTATITVDEDTTLPSGWSSSNVGNANGSSNFSPCAGNNGAFVLTATGFSTSSSDVLHTAYQEICGNSEVTARVLTASGGGWAGITIRETLMPGSKKVGLKTQLTTNIRREIRTTTNGAASILNLIRPQHIWLRLTRSGNNFVAYTSPNGVNWSFAFSATIIMEGCAYVGIFSESINNPTTTTATFDQVSVTGTPAPLAGNLNQRLPVAESDDQVQLYPNPTTGELNIDLDVHAGKPGVVQIFNVLGEIVVQERLVAGEVEPLRTRIAGSSGVYTVVIQLDDRRIVRRVVVDPGGGK